MPTAVAGSVVGVIDDHAYVVALNINNAYDPLTDTWAARAPDPRPRSFAGAGVIAGKLYVAGGCINSDCIPGNTNILEVYDPVANAWTDKAPMPTARNQVGVGVLDGKLYVVGGQGQCGPCIATAVLEVYDPSTDTWATKAPMPTARMSLTVAVANGVLYAVGGAIRPPEPGIAVATVEAYDPVTDTWTSKAAMPTPREAAAGGVVNDIIYVAGGLGVSTSSGSFLSTVEAYEPIANAWTTMAPMPTARAYFSVGVVSGRLYAVGGVNPAFNPPVIGANEAFTPPCATAPSGLVSWWPGEGNANDIVDGNSGTLQGGATFAAGYVGQAFLLDGVNAYVDAGNAPNLHVSGGDFTVEAWVRFNALGGDMSIMDKMSASGVNTDGWRLIKQGDNRFWFCLGGGGGNRCYDPSFTLFSTTVAQTGVWYHVAVVKSAGGFSLSVNGVQEDARSSLPPFLDTHAAILRIGSYVLEGAHLNGEVDEVSIYNRALSAAQIQAIYAAASAGKCPPPVANIAGPTSAVVGELLSFSGAGSSDPGGAALTYSWDFGDQTAPATTVTASHAYAATGAYTVTLTVSNGSLTGTATSAVTVAQAQASVALAKNPTGSSVFGQSVTFTATVSATPPGGGTPDGSVKFYEGGTCTATGTLLDTKTLASGQAQLSIATLSASASAHTVVACYQGSTNYLASGNSISQTVGKAQVTSTASVSPSTGQYSDKVTLSTTISIQGAGALAGQTLTGSVAFTIGTDPVSCTTASVTVSATAVPVTVTCSPNYPVTQSPGGPFIVSARFTSTNANFNGTSGSAGETTAGLTVTKEEAAIDYLSSNLGALPVSQNSFALTVNVRERYPEPNPNPDPNGLAAAGDITKTGLSASLSGVSSAANYNGSCTPGTVSGTGYSSNRPFTCTFAGGPFTVDAYTVNFTVTGNYHKGSYDDALTVYDPTAGFVTGGGKFTWQGDRVSFGLSFTYTKGKTTPRGGLVVIRHHADGGTCRVKSNSLDAPAVTGTAASYTGKGNYTCVDAYGSTTASAGNLSLLGYVEDNATPGAGLDKFWLQNQAAYGELSMPSTAKANAVLLTGGNIQVPQQGSK